MIEERQKMILNTVTAFIGFIIAVVNGIMRFGSEFMGSPGALLIPTIFLVFGVCSLIFTINLPNSKIPYIVMACLNGIFIIGMLSSIIFVLATANRPFNPTDYNPVNVFLFPILITIPSVILLISYISIVVDIYKIDKKISEKHKNKDR